LRNINHVEVSADDLEVYIQTGLIDICDMNKSDVFDTDALLCTKMVRSNNYKALLSIAGELFLPGTNCMQLEPNFRNCLMKLFEVI